MIQQTVPYTDIDNVGHSMLPNIAAVDHVLTLSKRRHDVA